MNDSDRAHAGVAMLRRALAVALAVLPLGACGSQPEPARPALNLPPHFRNVDTLTAHGSITVLLEMWHRAAARGDFDAYFSKMTGDAVFLGTDRTERWTRDEFEAFARPYFDGVEAWTYMPVSREIALEPRDDPSVAWVDEVLWNEKYGYCRGTGLAVRQPDGAWLIHRYSLSFLIPNDKAAAVMGAVGPQEPPGP